MWLQVVVDIDGDGSFLMNCQELATAAIEGLETKVMILNNQHLGMVVQWEDRFYKANRAHTYLGRRVSIWRLISLPGGCGMECFTGHAPACLGAQG